MAYAISSDGARIHYELHGDGPPVLLIMGLGSNAYGWYRTIPWLSQHHRVIAFDNRGVGRSDVPEGPYTMAQMAADTAAVIQASGHERVDVIGASLGGMIAQHLTLAHASRVRSLTLICTTPGGPNSVRAADNVLAAMVEGGEDPSTIYRRNAWFLYSDDTRTNHPERIEDDLVHRQKIPTTPAGYLGQVQAAMGHDTWDQLSSIAVPTLVVHGTADLLIPPDNGRLLAERIAGAQLVLVPGAGHMLQSDGGDVTREAILAFLGRVASN